MAAIVEAINVVKTALEAAGLSVHVNRDESNPIQIGEMPCINLFWGGAEVRKDYSCDAYQWNGQVILDCWAQIETGVPVLNGCDALVAQVAAVFGDDYTFGGKFIQATITAVGGLETMQEGSGSIGVTSSLEYQTTVSDWSTISS